MEFRVNFFRYISYGLMALVQMADQGARAESMRPSFPSITFPNHYTLVTGLRPDHHGIVSNTMEDAAIPGGQFKLSRHEAVTDRRWWDQAEPVWVSAEKAGMRSATMYWPGSEADIHGVRPSYWKVFDHKVSAEERVDQLLAWLDLPPSQRPAFLTLYFDEVDHMGHEYGPDSEQVNEALRHVDSAVGRLVVGLSKRQLTANIVVVSDHGMTATSEQRLIQLKPLLPAGSYRLVVSGAYAGLEPVAGHERELAAALAKTHPHMQCWPKQQIPARFEYGHNPRVPAYICLADAGWLIVDEKKAGEKTSAGAHGYDNFLPEMGALFIAQGPAFRSHQVLARLDNVDVYPLLMHLLNVPAQPSDGKAEATAALLK